jgi:SAM-dependent methyltransferase
MENLVVKNPGGRAKICLFYREEKIRYHLWKNVYFSLYLLLMKLLCTLQLILLLVSCRSSYLSFNKDGFHGSFYKSFEKLQQQHGPVADFYNFKPGQKVASIGAQTCVGEAIYSCFSDSVEFYLEDIDTAYFNAAQAAYVWNHYGNLRGKPLTSTYKLITGTPDATLLPELYFDKCLIINSFHEFTQPDAMLKDIHRKIKPGGLLYIDELVPKTTGKKHGNCNMPLYTAREMDDIVCAAGFKVIEGYVVIWRKGKPWRKIYTYQKL